MYVKHNKTGKIYCTIGGAVNCTNAQDQQQMIMYIDGSGINTYVREEKEFWEKFTPVNNCTLNEAWHNYEQENPQ
jgi:hypothetical protein